MNTFNHNLIAENVKKTPFVEKNLNIIKILYLNVINYRMNSPIKKTKLHEKFNIYKKKMQNE